MAGTAVRPVETAVSGEHVVTAASPEHVVAGGAGETVGVA